MAESFFDKLNKNKTLHTPDVLSCLSNLSNDEVFTSPEVANNMLDLVPQELFSDPNAKFLDPACKTGVFLREIAKRLIVGLKDKIPDLNKRIDHIFHNQLYGIAITELTSLLSRRSLYCSKYPNGEYSISHFDTAEGNIRFRRISHEWVGGKCKFCGASEAQWKRDEGKETHAYEFIHTDSPESIFNMKFDLIISNPPYQLNDGGGTGSSAKPIYQKYVQAAKTLRPRYLAMIIPARWMTGGKGLDEFREVTINDKHFTVLHDFANAEECFSGVDIKGGVCYFLWERDIEKKCDIYRHDSNGISHSQRFLVEEGDDVFIRYPELVSIKNKVWQHKAISFETIVSSRKPYGLASDFFINPAKFGLPPVYDTPFIDGYSVWGLVALKRLKKYIPNNYPLPKDSNLDEYKIFISKAYGVGEIGESPADPILATPGELCTETFLEIGNFNTRSEAENALTYLKTKFFRCLVGIRKQTQNSSMKDYHYVPMQDFTKPWTDEELYKKYDLSQEEINFIESMIKPME